MLASLKSDDRALSSVIVLGKVPSISADYWIGNAVHCSGVYRNNFMEQEINIRRYSH